VVYRPLRSMNFFSTSRVIRHLRLGWCWQVPARPSVTSPSASFAYTRAHFVLYSFEILALQPCRQTVALFVLRAASFASNPRQKRLVRLGAQHDG
jgi:hypothetical protein